MQAVVEVLVHRVEFVEVQKGEGHADVTDAEHCPRPKQRHEHELW